MRIFVPAFGVLLLAIASGLAPLAGQDKEKPAEAPKEETVEAYDSKTNGAIQVRVDNKDPTHSFDVQQDGKRVFKGASDPKHANSYYGLAINLTDQKKLDEAIAAFRKTIEIKRNHELAHTHLGYTLMKKGWNLAKHSVAKLRDLRLALLASQEAVELVPTYTMAWQYLGWIRYWAGNFKPSIEALEKSCKLQKGGTGDAGQWIVLALAHAKLAAQEGLPEKERGHHKSEARRWYDQADKQIDQWWRGVRPGHDVGQTIWDFRTEARELMAAKDNKK